MRKPFGARATPLLARGLLAFACCGACDDSPARVIALDGGVRSETGRPESVEPVDFGAAPPLRTVLGLGDRELAVAALSLLGEGGPGGQGRCGGCHALGRPTLTLWAKLTRDFVAACLDRTTFSDQRQLDETYRCLSDHAARFGPAPSAAALGVYSAATHLPWLGFVLEHATDTAADFAAERARWVERAGMPRAGALLSQDELNLLAEWFARDLPLLFELVPEDSGVECEPGVAPRLASELSELSAVGWRAKSRETPLLMFGCAPGVSGSGCLGSLPLAVEEGFGETWQEDLPEASIRILRDNGATPTTFWSRSSADGRYVGSGLRDPGDPDLAGQIVDLSRGERILANFSYDATFFPDNSGFVAQQTHYGDDPSDLSATDGEAAIDDVALICSQSVLESGDDVTGLEDECLLLGGRIGLYQQLAQSLDGEDYWVVHGSYVSDDDGFSPTLGQPAAAFSEDSRVTLTPLVNLGNAFEAGDPTRVGTSRQGDPTLSPSGRLLVTRVKGPERVVSEDGFDRVTAEQSGYALHVVSTSSAGGSWSASLEDVGRVCLTGGKATFSYDERWLVLHHYVTGADATDLGFAGEDDPAFADYAELGASNLWLVDLLSGASRRVTRMAPGQYALFPHFRADNWIYFVVRSIEGDEWFAASDAALVLEGE